MQVRIVVIGDCYGKLGLFWAPGQKKWVDEKQAELGVEAKVFEIIERPERPTYNKVTKPKNVR